MSLPLAGRWRSRLIGALIIVVGLVTWFGVISDAPLPDHRWLKGHNDLFLHAGAFGVLSLMGLLLWASMGRVIWGLVMAAGAIEVIQLYRPTRHGEFSDFAASCAGIAAGAAIFLALSFVVARRAAGRAEPVKPK